MIRAIPLDAHHPHHPYNPDDPTNPHNPNMQSTHHDAVGTLLLEHFSHLILTLQAGGDE